jgi:hypothetical protein
MANKSNLNIVKNSQRYQTIFKNVTNNKGSTPYGYSKRIPMRNFSAKNISVQPFESTSSLIKIKLNQLNSEQ